MTTTNNLHDNSVAVATGEKVIIDDPAINKPLNPKDSYEGRKYDPEIDGPQQAS